MWKNNRVIPNRLNYCVIFIVCTQFTNVAAGSIIQAGGPRVGDPCCRPYLRIYLAGRTDLTGIRVLFQ
jgi:hypothetical protein